MAARITCEALFQSRVGYEKNGRPKRGKSAHQVWVGSTCTAFEQAASLVAGNVALRVIPQPRSHMLSG